MTEKVNSPNLLHLVQKTIAEEPEVVLLAGRCVEDNSLITIYPRPQDETLSFVVKRQEVIYGPVNVEVDLKPYTGQHIQALKLRKGSRVLLRQAGDEREVELTPAAEREGTCSFAPSSGIEVDTRVPTRPTQCIFLAEFSCFTGRYLGWCFGFWDCGFVEVPV